MSNWKKMPVHPLAAMFPRPTEMEHVALVQDMKERGYDKDHPIYTVDGAIIDGISRRDAAVEAGVEPTFKEHKSNDLVGFVISRNLHRRHLTTSQRQMIAADIANQLKESSVQDHARTSSYAPAAKLLNVTERGAESAATVKRDAVPEVVEAVRKGTVTVNDAKQIKDEKPAVQRRAVRDVESGKSPTARAAVQNRNPDNVRDAAAERVKRQETAQAERPGGSPAPELVPCRYCAGHGRVPADQAEYPSELDTEEFHDAWERWKAERRAKKIKPYTAGGENGQLKKMASWGARRAIFAIDASIAQGYQGIFEPSANGKKQAEQFSTIKEWYEEEMENAEH